MGCEAPLYEGIQPLLVPADGRRLKIDLYPECFETLFYGPGPPIQRWMDGTFAIPKRSPDVTDDIHSDARLVREFFYDLRDGELHYKVRKIENKIDSRHDHRADAMAYALQGLKRG